MSPPLSPPPPPPPPPSPPPPPPPAVRRTGIIDETGAMSDEFFIGESDSNSSSAFTEFSDGNEEGREEEQDIKNKSDGEVRVKFEKYKSEKGEKYERHCPGKDKMLNRVVPRPESTKDLYHGLRVVMRFDSAMYHILVWLKIKMVPEISFGRHIRVALDIGCGVASFGVFLLQRNVTTLSIAPKDVHENQIQFALELPAMVAVFATHRLLYPGQAFDLMHCSRCRINWTRDDGILLLEANRMLRAGGYFAWAAQPVYKHEVILQEQWKEIEDLTARICWELIKKEGCIALWQKPLKNSCYVNRDIGVLPPLCDLDDNSDNVWPQSLITLHDILIRKIEDLTARVCWELIKKEGCIALWQKPLKNSCYVNRDIGVLPPLCDLDDNSDNVWFAAALHDLLIDCWVMNVVPVSGFNTLPVIYDCGLVRIMHDWCEPLILIQEHMAYCMQQVFSLLRRTGVICQPSCLKWTRCEDLVDMYIYVIQYLSCVNFKKQQL
ncbi:hypothetical protein DITRI_Ditri05aG0114600 [Diplodiscus trichospermus]